MRQLDNHKWAISKAEVQGICAEGDVISDGNLTMVGEGDWRKAGLRIDEITEDEYIGSLIDLEKPHS
ncbi:hypothetical protein [Aidingimonas lacisalsi]|uniref:hypothetical protein n=1 Tax=Aidingimonas lacisalsi TaxID=2604086 RepID=UPI0011D22252|nr:hypothetical protein [Aidingimonas lacisalsi]